MFWNVFFEGAIYGCWLGGYTQIFFQIQYSKLMFWNVFFEGAIYGCWLGGLGGYTQSFFQFQTINLCSEMYFLRK